MKKNKMILAAAAVLMSASLAACGSGKKEETPQTATQAATATATQSEVSADDEALTALENTVVPEMPKLKDMGMVKMADISSITVESEPKMAVDDEMLDSQISSLLSSYLEEIEEPAKDGDTVNIDYIGKIDGTAFDGGTGSKYDLKLGSGQFIDGFEDQLIGAKKGDKVIVKVTFPENYGKEELNGKPAEFEVTVNKVSRIPELTDKWISEHAEELESDAKTAEEFKEEQRSLLQASIDAAYNNNIQSDALQQLVDKSEIGVTTEMKEYAEAYIIRLQIDQAAQYGYKISDILKMNNMTVDQFKEEMQSYAADYAEQRVLMSTIAEEQGITATDEVIDNYINNINALYGTNYNKIQLIEQFGGDLVKQEAVDEAVFEYIRNNVKVVELSQDELEAKSESEATEETEEETTAEVVDREGEGGFKTKSVTSIYEPVTEETTAVESESAAK